MPAPTIATSAFIGDFFLDDAIECRSFPLHSHTHAFQVQILLNPP